FMKSLFLILMFSGAVLAESVGFPETGTDDFMALARSGKIVDKTLLIKDLIEKKDSVTLITRPRRWGKSTSMSMLWRFFSLEHDRAEAKANRELFENLKIKNATTQEPVTGRQVNVVDQFQGKCPSIFLSFKDVRGETLEELIVKLKTVISAEFHHHRYLALDLEKKASDGSSAYNKKMAQSYLEDFERLSLNKGRTASKHDLENSLLFLSQLLYDYHNKTRVCVFVDEYDAPLHVAFTRGYLTAGVEVIRTLFGSVLKGNKVLERGILTGILRLAKANLFSGINNLVEDNVFNSHYSSHYGFTDGELGELFSIFSLERKDKEIFRESYNGYKFYEGDNESSKVAIYNPWSVIGYLKNNAQLLNYWVGSGGTELLDHLVVHPDVQDALATLRSGKPIHIKIPKDVTFSGLTDSPSTLWPLLVHTGYLTLANAPMFHLASEEYEVDLVIPNTEIRSAYSRFHSQWLKSNNLPGVSSIERYDSLVASIVAKDVQKVRDWIEYEKASGEPIDFTSTKWFFNPLQLAALSGDVEIFKTVDEHYTTLRNSVDFEGLNIGDYGLLSGLQISPALDLSIFKDGTPGFSEFFCYAGGLPLVFVPGTVLTLASFLKVPKTPGAVAVAGAGAFSIAFSAYLKDLAGYILKYSLGSTCTRYQKYHGVHPKDFSTLLQFGEFVVRNRSSYLSLSTCRTGDALVSQFQKAATQVRHAETEPLVFSLCQSKSNSDL
ncbi:MAG: AAA family ATPase, partial [Myxococcaceae bacterium]